MSVSKGAVALRVAAAEWAAGLKAPIIDSKDSSFMCLDQRLQRAAVRYAMVKRNAARPRPGGRKQA